MPNRLTNYACAVAIAFVLACVGPAIEAWDDAQRTAASAAEAEHTAQQRHRFERAAQALCGQNAGWRETADGAVQCYTHRGHPTLRVSL